MGMLEREMVMKNEHRATYKRGGRSAQVDYILCMRENLKEFSACKGVPGECVTRQHKVLVGKMSQEV